MQCKLVLQLASQPPLETTPLAALRHSQQPDRHVKTLAEQRALYLARPNSVNQWSLWSEICDERHCRYDATRGEGARGGLTHRAATAFPARNCFPAQIHRRWLRIAIRSILPPSLPPACAVRKAGGFCGLLRKSHGNIFLGSPAFHRDILQVAGCAFPIPISCYVLEFSQ